jgi:hypothetical protein
MVQQLFFKFRAALILTVTIPLATSSLAQATVVVGTGKPDVDARQFGRPSIWEKSF